MTEQENKTLTEIAVNTALVVQSTGKMEEHLRILNSKVADHEKRMLLSEEEVKTLKEASAESKKFRVALVSKSIWAAICLSCIVVFQVIRYLSASGALAAMIK